MSVDGRIIELRKQGYGYKTIAKQLGLKRDDVRYICQKNGLVGVMSRNNTESLDEREKKFKDVFENKFPGFAYHSGFKNVDSYFKYKCRKCGVIQEKNAQCVRRKKKLRCDNCTELYKLKKTIIKLLWDLIKDKEKQTNALVRQEIELLKKLSSNHRYHLRCPECGRVFFSSVDKKTCGSACANRRENRLKEITRRKRLRINGRIDWDITLDKLYERDTGICYLCGGKCDKNDFTVDVNGNFVAGPMYPSIDHVKPVSKGGTHTWDNVRLAHHYCNTIKSNKELKIS